jgi:hypothetical protein
MAASLLHNLLPYLAFSLNSHLHPHLLSPFSFVKWNLLCRHFSMLVTIY